MEQNPTGERTGTQGAERALAEENISILRARQYEILKDSELSDDQKVAAIDETVRDYIGSHGIEADDPEYSTYYDSLRRFSADEMTNIQWRYGNWDQETKTLTGKTGADKVHDLQMQLFGRRLDFDQTSASGNADLLSESEMAEYETIAHGLTLKELEKSREVWATESAKRQGKLAGGKNDDAEASYHQSVRIAGITEMSDQIDDADDTTTKNAKVIKYLFEEQVRLREATTEKLQDTKLSRYTEWMRSGTRMQKIGKGALIAAGAAGVGILGFLAAPIVGVGAGVAGGVAAAAGGTARFAKTYAKTDRDRGMDTAETSYGANGEGIYDVEAGSSTDLKDRFDEVATVYNDGFEEDTKREQRKRLKAVGAGVLAIAAGTGIAALATNFGEIAENAQDAWSWVKDRVNGDLRVGAPDADGELPDGTVNDRDLDGDGTENRFDTSPDGVEDPDLDRDGDGVRNWQDTEPDNPDITDETFSLPEISEEARFVTPNEGGFQTLQELGVPEEKREKIWAQVGEILHEQGKTYHMDDGRFGWSSDMRLSDADLRTFVQVAKRNGVAI